MSGKGQHGMAWIYIRYFGENCTGTTMDLLVLCGEKYVDYYAFTYYGMLGKILDLYCRSIMLGKIQLGMFT
jgi:hypothetical protein